MFILLLLLNQVVIHQLLGNEPCIDPMYRVKNDYFETITIVDPLELPEQVESGLRVTTIIPAHVENHFLEDFNQQAVSPLLCIHSSQMSMYLQSVSAMIIIVWYPMPKLKTTPANRHVNCFAMSVVY